LSLCFDFPLLFKILKMHYQVNVAYDRALKQLLKLIAIFMSKKILKSSVLDVGFSRF